MANLGLTDKISHFAANTSILKSYSLGRNRNKTFTDFSYSKCYIIN